jgi:hypothetical protein
MMVERYPNLKEEVGGSIPREICSQLDRRICQVINCLLCFGVGLSAFSLIKKILKNSIGTTSVMVFSVMHTICKGFELDA